MGKELSKAEWVKVVLIAGIGSILEWFDFFIFALLKDYINAVFFPKDAMSQGLSDIFYWTIFAAGFAMRPLGALFFGWLGDTLGRNVALVSSISGMALSTVVIGILPAYSYGSYTAGLVSPILLAIFRIIQGFCTGGEYGAALVYISELADPKHRCIKVNMVQACVQIGISCATILVMILDAACSYDQMLIWGWRIPFLLGAVTGFFGFVLRRKMPEPEAFLNAARKEKKMLESIKSLKSGQTVDEEQSKQGMLEDSTSQSYYQLQSAQRSLAEESLIEEENEDDEKGKNSKNDDPRIVKKLSRAMITLHGNVHSSIPLVRLLRNNWMGLLLHIGFSAWNPTSFYLASTWLPGQVKYLGISGAEMRGVFLVYCTITVIVLMIVGHLLDKGMRAIYANAVLVTLGTGTACGIFYGTLAHKVNSAGFWCLSCLFAVFTAAVTGTNLYPGIRIYAPLERTTGYGFGINVANGVLGGVTPLVVTGIINSLNGNTSLIPFAPTFWLLGMMVWVLISCVFLYSYAPYINMKYIGHLED